MREETHPLACLFSLPLAGGKARLEEGARLLDEAVQHFVSRGTAAVFASRCRDSRPSGSASSQPGGPVGLLSRAPHQDASPLPQRQTRRYRPLCLELLQNVEPKGGQPNAPRGGSCLRRQVAPSDRSPPRGVGRNLPRVATPSSLGTRHLGPTATLGR